MKTNPPPISRLRLASLLLSLAAGAMLPALNAQVTITSIPALLGGDLTDPEDDGIDATGAGNDPAAFNWNFKSITASDEPDFEGGEFSYNIFDNKVGGGNAKWCCNGPPVSITVEFDAPVSLTHFTVTSSNDTPARDPRAWSIQGSVDGVAFDIIYEDTDASVSLWSQLVGDARNSTLRFDLDTPTSAYHFFRYEATATGGNHALNEIEYFGSVDVTDTDGDGMTDVYEDNNGLDKNVDDSGGDLDSDGLTNLQEFNGGTDPQDDDTDDDGLLDGVETKTGTWVSASDTGTDPKNDDSDNDGLLDGVETNTGTFTNANDTGTDPNNPDTDGDSFADGNEVNAGTDPHDPNSKPGVPLPYLYFDFEEGGGTVLNDRSGNDFDGNIERGVTFVSGAPGGPTPAGGASFNAGLVQVPGLDAPSQLAHRDSNPDGSYTLMCWMKPDAVSLSGDRFFWGQTTQGIHNGLRGSGTLHTAHWGSDFNAATPLTADEWIHAAWTYDGPTDTAYIYLNGVQDGGPFSQLGPNGSGNLILGGRNGGSENFAGCVDDVAVWQEVLPAGAISAIANGAAIIPTEDTDGDGMTDVWEDQFGLNKNDPADAALDGDGDGLSNLEEFTLRTDPNNDDTDGDGLKDGVETNTGIWVSASDTGTNPKSADSDGDGLDDGVETNTGTFASVNDTGTDPNKVDTDGDGFRDLKEVQNGSDPNDPADRPAVPIITSLGTGTAALRGGDLTDPEDDGVEGNVPADGDWSSLNWNWVSIEASEENYFGNFGGSEGAYDLFDNQVGAGQTKWCCSNPPQWLTVEFEEPISLESFTVTSGNDVPARDPLAWNISGSNDNATWEIIFEQDDPVSLWTQRLEVIEFVLPKPSKSYKFIRYEVTQTGGGHQINEIEYFGTVGKKSLFFDVDSDGDSLVLIWESQGGELYNVRSETDLSAGGEDGPVTWPIFDGHEDIEATPPFNTLTIPRPADPTRFFVVEAFPAPPESIFSDDFESGQGGWTVGTDGAAGTAWELGTPTTGPGAANSPANCFATNLAGDYQLDADIWLRSPPIDLTTAGSATLNFFEFRDIEEGFDSGAIRVLDAANDSVLAIIDDAVDGVTAGWELYTKAIPPEGLGKTIKIEFRFTSDEIQNFAGWYVDDVLVTVP